MAELKLFPIVGWETRSTPTGYGSLTVLCHPGMPKPGLSQPDLDRATNVRGIAPKVRIGAMGRLFAHEIKAEINRLKQKLREAGQATCS